MKRAEWNGVVLAESNDIIEVEGNAYFPETSLKLDHFKLSETHSVCAWKGTASYYSIDAGGSVNADAAWFYPQPKDAAKQITGRVAFWKGVKVHDA